MKRNVFIILGCIVLSGIYAQTSITGCYLSGAMINPGSTAGCGNGTNYCNLASVYVPLFTPTACGASTSSGGVSHTKSSSWTIPAGCTASAIAEYKKRNYFGSPVNPSGTGCSNCGMDGSPDGLQITQSGGVVVAQSSTIVVNVGTCGAYPTLGTYTTAVATLSPGCNNADATVQMIVTGGVLTIRGTSNRADEIITFTINLSGTCGPSCSSVLPIQLISFSGQEEDNKVKLVWDIAMEKDVNYYLLEKSSDGINFSTLGKIKANNLPYRSLYSSFDYYPNKGINYYRLTNVDTDGSKGEAYLIALDIINEPVRLWYNQNSDELILFYNERLSKETIQLTDLSGKILKEIALASEESYNIKISKSGITPGMYLLRTTGGTESMNLKLIIE